MEAMKSAAVDSLADHLGSTRVQFSGSGWAGGPHLASLPQIWVPHISQRCGFAGSQCEATYKSRTMPVNPSNPRSKLRILLTSCACIAARCTASRADRLLCPSTICLARSTVGRSTENTSSTTPSSASNAGWIASGLLIATTFLMPASHPAGKFPARRLRLPASLTGYKNPLDAPRIIKPRSRQNPPASGLCLPKRSKETMEQISCKCRAKATTVMSVFRKKTVLHARFKLALTEDLL
jgi:hypothetical protein